MHGRHLGELAEHRPGCNAGRDQLDLRVRKASLEFTNQGSQQERVSQAVVGAQHRNAAYRK